MGNMKDLVGMIPGASKAMKDVEIEDDAFKHIRHPWRHWKQSLLWL
jgi:signal recognition particle GTPase